MFGIGKPRIGLLPLMLEMYKEYSPELADKQKPFIQSISSAFQNFSEVVEAPICSKRDEIKLMIQEFERKDCDIIVIVYISYATSISALNPLLETHIPLLLFSTTPRSSMAAGICMEDIMLNHGVHGYMDLANVLRRNKRHYIFVSGKKDDPEALNEIEQWSWAAHVKNMLKKSTIGIAGYPFDGMGDLGIDTTLLNTTLGPEVKHIPLNLLSDRIQSISDDNVEEEIKKDREKYTIDKNVSADILKESNRLYLGLLKVINELSIDAFTMHFQGILENPHIKTLPFWGISKLQEQGVPYAGEGDLLGATANLMIKYLCNKVLFTETFCPDFNGGRIVMGHMGESNPAFGISTRLRRKKFVFGKAIDPVIADVTMEEGKATVVNLGVVEDNAFQLTVYSGTICRKIPGSDDIDMPYFHFKPDGVLEDFLTKFGLAGGTHHSAITKGDKKEEIKKLAEILKIKLVILE